MELAPVTEPWTAAVPWARPWRRHAASRRSAATSRTPVRAEAVPAGDPRLEIAWTLALIELAAARLRLAEAAGGDPWTEAMAGHEVYLATGRVRLLEEQLGEPGEPVRWAGV